MAPHVRRVQDHALHRRCRVFFGANVLRPPCFFFKEDGMNRYIAELVGTFVLVFCGVGAAVIDGDKLGPLGISLAFGLTLVAMAYAVGPISGCHINPAVTIGLAVAGRMKWQDVPGYVIAQLVGGIAGAGALLPIVSN